MKTGPLAAAGCGRAMCWCCCWLGAESSPSPCRDLLRIGVTLAGHQKKILSSIQDMRLQMNQTLPVQV